MNVTFIFPCCVKAVIVCCIVFSHYFYHNFMLLCEVLLITFTHVLDNDLTTNKKLSTYVLSCSRGIDFDAVWRCIDYNPLPLQFYFSSPYVHSSRKETHVHSQKKAFHCVPYRIFAFHIKCIDSMRLIWNATLGLCDDVQLCRPVI